MSFLCKDCYYCFYDLERDFADEKIGYCNEKKIASSIYNEACNLFRFSSVFTFNKELIEEAFEEAVKIASVRKIVPYQNDNFDHKKTDMLFESKFWEFYELYINKRFVGVDMIDKKQYHGLLGAIGLFPILEEAQKRRNLLKNA